MKINKKNWQKPLNLIVPIGLIIFYSILYKFYHFTGRDWEVFQQTAFGNFSKMVVPYWAIFLSWIPAHLPDPWGYMFWISVGLIAILIAANYLKAPIFPLFTSFQLAWVLYYGQIDGLIIAGIILGLWADKKKNAWLLGMAILLVLIKPQIGLFIAIIFWLWSDNKTKTTLIIVLVLLLSLIIWPDWPQTLLLNQWNSFLESNINNWANTSIGFPIWFAGLIGVVGTSLIYFTPIEKEKKILSTIALTFLLSPYSTVYSQLSLIIFRLPKILYIFAIAPWFKSFLFGPFDHWQWMILFPFFVLIWSMWPGFIYWREKFKTLAQTHNFN